MSSPASARQRFRHRVVSLDEVREHLNANYMLSGSFRVDGDRIYLNAELADAKSSGIALVGIRSMTR